MTSSSDTASSEMSKLHSNHVPSPTSSVPSIQSARPNRPMLKRLDTSERIKVNTAALNKNEEKAKIRNCCADEAESSTNIKDEHGDVNASQSSRKGLIRTVNGNLSTQQAPRLKLDTNSGSSSSSGGSSGVSSTSSSWQRNSPHHDPLVPTFGWTPVTPSRNGIVSSELIHGPSQAHRSHSENSSQKRRDSERSHDFGSLSAVPNSIRTPISPTRSFSLSSGAVLSATFEPSEILSNFLYLGPEITTPSEVEYLRKGLGIRRILNAAYEIEDGGGKHLNLNNEEKSGFERYLKLPLKDSVEAKGVQGYIERACAFLDDARLHSAPAYVHCKAGKSRSVMLVMAYLIHCNRWTLQRSYAYVVDRRQDVSPNIGFVAELMAFEEKRLGKSKSGEKMLSNSTKGEQEEVKNSFAETFYTDSTSEKEVIEQTASPDMIYDPTIPWVKESKEVGSNNIVLSHVDGKLSAPDSDDSQNLIRDTQNLSLRDKEELSPSLERI